MKLDNSKITGFIVGALGIGTFVFSSNLAKAVSGIIYDPRCSGIDNNTVGQIKEALLGISCNLGDIEKFVFLVSLILIFIAFLKIVEKE